MDRETKMRLIDATDDGKIEGIGYIMAGPAWAETSKGMSTPSCNRYFLWQDGTYAWSCDEQRACKTQMFKGHAVFFCCADCYYERK